jgi:DNA-binding NarL/FixJ family response regulator
MKTSSAGSDFLAHKNEVARLARQLPRLQNMLIVEDDISDSDRLRATLRVILGYEFLVRVAATLGSALDGVLSKQPDLVFLDDLLKPSDTATHSIPFLRRAGYTGPIVVISGQVTRNRRAELMALGAAEVIHKDDVDSVRLTEALARVYGITA